MSAAQFKAAGHSLVDKIAEFLAGQSERPVAPPHKLSEVREIIGHRALPKRGADTGVLLDRAAELMFNYSALNGHPRWFGYITSSAAPIGALADMLAAAVNPNAGAYMLAPITTEIEAEAIRWIGELIGFPGEGGILTSGGNVANMVALWAARRARIDFDVRADGLRGQPQMVVYGSAETHTWIHKATDLSGIGTSAIRWIETDDQQRMKVDALDKAIEADLKAGNKPFFVVGTAGSVSTGAIDPLPAIAALCKEHALWFHVDGAYGAPAAALPDASSDLRGLSLADSVAVDPHKWLYSALEAGCVLVKDPKHLLDAFCYHPDYYHFLEQDDSPIYYSQLGLQNSRGGRALKVWLGIQQAGGDGIVAMIADDIRLAKELYAHAEKHAELEALTHSLSITTFRYLPPGLDASAEGAADYLSALNKQILERMQLEGGAYVSNAVIDGAFVLRACIVNFRTTSDDIEALVDISVNLGRKIDAELRPDALKQS